MNDHQSQSSAQSSKAFAPVRTAGKLAMAAVGVGIAYSRAFVDHDVPLPPALSAEQMEVTSPRAGPINVYADRRATGRPLLLVHSINAAPSAYEMKPLFEQYRTQRPTYAVDLPGFGFSDRSARRYSPELYVHALEDVLDTVVGSAADVVALSLGAEFAVGAAIARPDLVNSLALLSPTGFSPASAVFETLAGGGAVSSLVHTGLSLPLLGQSLYDLVTSRKSIDYYVGKAFAGDAAVDFADYAYLTSHQPGARHAPFYFLSGQLFAADALGELYARVARPLLVIYDEDPNVSFERLPELLDINPHSRAVRIAPTMGLPHWEKLQETAAALDEFWQTAS